MGQITRVILGGSRRESWIRYGLAAALVALAVLLRHLLDPLLGHELPLLLFYANVMVTGSLLGTGPGLLACALGYVAGVWFFVEPRQSLALLSLQDWVTVVRYFVISLLFLGILHALQKAQVRAMQQQRQVQREHESLQRSLDLLERIAQGTHDLIAAVDIQMRFTLINPPYCREFSDIFGVEPQLGRSPAQVLEALPDAAAQVQAVWARALAGESFALTQEFGDPDRQRSWFEILCYPVRGGSNQIIGAAMIARNVSVRMKSEDALRQSERRLRTFFEADMVGTIYWNMNGLITDANDKFLRMVGYTRQDLRSGRLEWSRMTPPEYFDTDEFALDELRATGVDTPYEKEFYRKDGTRVPVIVGAALFDRGHNEGVAFVLDITDRKRTEEALRASEERYRATFELAPVGIAHVGLDGRWLRFNDTLCSIAGYSRAELQALTFVDITHPDDVEPDWQQARRLLAGEIANYTMEKRYVRKGGQIVWISLTATLQRNAEGQPVHFIVAVTDISKRKQIEHDMRELTRTLEEHVARRTADADRKTEQLRRLHAELINAEQKQRKQLAQVLHDGLQQLLVAAKMRIGLMQVRVHDERLRADVREVEDLLGQAINDSRSLTAELSPPVLYDRGLITALEWLARYMEDKHRLHVHVIAEEEVEPDREELRVFLFQAARELLLNVRKYAGVSEATLTVAHCDGCIELQVEDQGVGFDPAEAFRERTSGGYGLFSVRERVELLDGHLEIHSAPGQGTRVRLEVPMTPAIDSHQLPDAEADRESFTYPVLNESLLGHERAANDVDSDALQRDRHDRRHHDRATISADASSPSSAASSRTNEPGTIRVVLADDHQILRQGLAGLLRAQADITVVGEASDGMEAVELAHHLQPDVVVMDGSMPRMDGVTATQHIRRDTPATQVIGLSMHTEEDMAAAMVHAGAAAYLRKDGPADRLVAAIRQCYRSNSTPSAG